MILEHNRDEEIEHACMTLEWLRRNMAGWDEIELQSERIIKEFLTGRTFADVNGPRGIELGAISTGRLQIPSNQPKEGVNVGIREVIRLIEVRKPFTLDLSELDNSSRSADDIDLRSLEKAAQQD